MSNCQANIVKKQNKGTILLVDGMASGDGIVSTFIWVIIAVANYNYPVQFTLNSMLSLKK